jgi:hypothetical protein
VNECGAKKRGGGECAAPAMRGQRRCARHGGKSPQAIAAAKKRVAEQEARDTMEKAIVTLGLPQDIDPAKALLDEISRTYGTVLWLQERVRKLEPDELTWGITERQMGLGKDGPIDVTTEKAEFNAWYQLYLGERKHLVAVTTAALKAGIEERRVRLAEQQGDLVAQAIRSILDALNLTPSQWELVPTVVPAALRSLGELAP